jgi:hypothetical protein
VRRPRKACEEAENFKACKKNLLIVVYNADYFALTFSVRN